MKKRIILSLLVTLSVFTLTGCGKNENKTDNISQSSSKLVCKMEDENEKSRYEFNFDKNDELVDGIYVIEVLNENKVNSSYNLHSKYGGFDDVKLDGNVITAKFTTNSTAISQMKYYTKDFKKSSIKNYFENNSKSVIWTCE